MARSVYKYRIDLTGKEKQILRQAKRKGRKDARLVIRILIIMLANKAKTIIETAETLGCCEQTVLNQRKQFLTRRAEGPVTALMDLPRSGRPVTYGPQQRTHITAMVCETLWEHELPLSRFSIADLLRVVRQEEGLASLSHRSLGRFLHQDALKPWRYRYWLFPRDPDFVRRACVILDLYAGFWEGQRLGADEYVLSADEKSIQVLARLHPGLPACVPAGRPLLVMRSGLSSSTSDLERWPTTPPGMSFAASSLAGSLRPRPLPPSTSSLTW